MYLYLYIFKKDIYIYNILFKFSSYKMLINININKI